MIIPEGWRQSEITGFLYSTDVKNLPDYKFYVILEDFEDIATLFRFDYKKHHKEKKCLFSGNLRNTIAHADKLRGRA